MERQAGPVAEEFGPRRFRFDILFALIAVTVLVIDQITKTIVRNSLDYGEAWPNEDWLVKIVHVSNSGAAFGILQGQTFFLVATSLVGIAAIVLYYMFPPMEHGALRIALALQLGGAAGNLSDRIRTGEVTDFIDFRVWPVFNLADTAIVLGALALAFSSLGRQDDPESRRETDEPVVQATDDPAA